MGLDIEIVDEWAVGLSEDKTCLADLLETIETADAGIDFLITHRDPHDLTNLLFIAPMRTEKEREIADQLGFYLSRNVQVRIEGEFTIGIIPYICRRIAGNGITFPGYSVSINTGRFLMYIRLDSRKEAERAVELLQNVTDM
jgi:hypothetical protein